MKIPRNREERRAKLSHGKTVEKLAMVEGRLTETLARAKRLQQEAADLRDRADRTAAIVARMGAS